VSDDIKELIRANFEDFFILAFHHTHPDTELSFDPYLRYICHRYQTLKKRTRIVFNQPPRSLKSWTAKYYVAWYLGRRPSTEVMIVSNIQELAELMAYDIRSILQAKWYRKIFPNTRVAKDRAAVNHIKTTKGGGVFAASVETSLAGFGADLLILDDPNKIRDASRPDRLEAVNRRFDGEIYSRLNNKKRSKVIVIQHRLNEVDLSGHLIEKGYERVALPLIGTRNKPFRLEDNAIWHRRKGDILVSNSYTQKDIEKLKQVTDPDFHWFYQQGIGRTKLPPFKLEHFQMVETPVITGATVVSIDTALRDGTSGSFNVIQVWQQTRDTFHLSHQFRQQCSFNELESAARSIVRRFRPAAVIIETAANGSALLSRLKKANKKMRFIPIAPTESKAGRLNRHRAQIQKGALSLQSDKDWASDYVLEFISFPAGYTDQIDATTQFLDFIAPKPILKALEPRATIAMVRSDGTKVEPQESLSHSTSPRGALVLGSRLRLK
jgi:predicted phage terminase large subunit-like protein